MLGVIVFGTFALANALFCKLCSMIDRTFCSESLAFEACDLARESGKAHLHFCPATRFICEQLLCGFHCKLNARRGFERFRMLPLVFRHFACDQLERFRERRKVVLEAIKFIRKRRTLFAGAAHFVFELRKLCLH
jgi:hypothetical protein